MESNSGSEKPSLAGKNRNYIGPKTHRAIIQKLWEEARWKDQAMSHYRIERMVLFFFNPGYGIGRYLKRGLKFTISYLGTFTPSHEVSVARRKKSFAVRKQNRVVRLRYLENKKRRDAENQ